MNLLFSMSFAGSLVFLVYLILRPVTVRYFSSAWRYRFLKAALIVYLLPYQYFKYLYYDIFSGVFFQRQYQSPEFSKSFFLYDMDKLILIDWEGNRLVKKEEKIIFIVLVIWSIVVIFFAIYQAVKYISCKKKLQRISTVTDINSYKTLNQCIRYACIKRKVKLSCCSYINTPFTIGIFSPHIFMPETLKEEKSFQMAISHELIHVRNHDIFIKFLLLFVLVLHWYNPLTYLLYWEICRVSEYVCDEAVIRNVTEEEKEKYGLLIIELAQKPSHVNTYFGNALSNNYKMIKKRIAYMNRSIISLRYIRIVSFVLAVLLLILSPLPVLAYSPMKECKWSHQSNACNYEGETYYSVLQQDVYCFFDICDPFLESGTEYDIFVGDSNIQEIICKTVNQTERSICIHTWENGQILRHIKNNDGSCIIYFYEGKKCSKCGIYETGDLISSMQYPKCPH